MAHSYVSLLKRSNFCVILGNLLITYFLQASYFDDSKLMKSYTSRFSKNYTYAKFLQLQEPKFLFNLEVY